MPEKIFLRDLSEISRGDGGGGGHEKWAAKRGRVTQICAPDHVEAHPQKTKEVLYFVKKKTTTKNCEVWIYFKDCTLRSDVMFVTSDTNIVSLKNMKWNQLSEAVSIFHEERETLTHHEVASGTELIGIINNIPEVNDEIDMTSSTLNANTLWEHQEKTVNLSDAAIAFINSLKLLPLCDHILQATDACTTRRCGGGFNARWTRSPAVYFRCILS